MKPLNELPYVEWTESSGVTRRLYADLYESDDCDFPATVTKNAVETGANITDHYKLEPANVRGRLFFSGSPVRGDLDDENPGAVRRVPLNLPEYPTIPIYTPRGALNAINPFATGPAGLPDGYDALQFARPPGTRLAGALQKLNDLRREGILVSVATTLGLVIDSLAIEGLRLSRHDEDGDGGWLELSCTQIIYATTDVAIAVPLPSEVRAQARKPGANAGGGTDVPAGPKKTAAKAAFDAARGAL